MTKTAVIRAPAWVTPQVKGNFAPGAASRENWEFETHKYPEQAIGVTQARAPRRLPLEDGELMPESEGLRLELETRPNGRPEGGDQGDEQRGYAAADRISLGA